MSDAYGNTKSGATLLRESKPDDETVTLFADGRAVKIPIF
jgi:hypothetical protein